MSQQEEAFAAIVSRLEDPEDRAERRAVLLCCALGLLGCWLAVVALVAHWPLPVAVAGLLAMATADLTMGLTLVRRFGRRRPAVWP